MGIRRSFLRVLVSGAVGIGMGTLVYHTTNDLQGVPLLLFSCLIGFVIGEVVYAVLDVFDSPSRRVR